MNSVSLSAVEEIFRRLEAEYISEPERFEEYGASYLFRLRDVEPCNWCVDFRKRPAVQRLDYGTVDCDCEVICDATDFVELCKGRENPQAFFHSRRLILRGESEAALALTEFLWKRKG